MRSVTAASVSAKLRIIHARCSPIAHSSSSIAGGRGWDAAVSERLQQLVAPGTLVTTNGLDCLAALRASKVKRPFLVFPAWFDDGTFEDVTALTTFSSNDDGIAEIDPDQIPEIHLDPPPPAGA